MFCTACGSKVSDGAKFCPGCGHAVRALQFVEAAPQACAAPGLPPMEEPVAAQTAPMQHAAQPAGLAPQPPDVQNEAPRKEGFVSRYFSFAGRVSREAHNARWAGLNITVAVIVNILAPSLKKADTMEIILYLLLIVIPIFVCGISLGVRRWHDLGKSGWYMLSVPLILPIFYMMAARGTQGPNAYGADPAAHKE